MAAVLVHNLVKRLWLVSNESMICPIKARTTTTGQAHVYHDLDNHECNREVWIRRNREHKEMSLNGWYQSYSAGKPVRACTAILLRFIVKRPA